MSLSCLLQGYNMPHFLHLNKPHDTSVSTAECRNMNEDQRHADSLLINKVRGCFMHGHNKRENASLAVQYICR